MQGEDDLRGLAKIMAFMRAVSILLILMHFYWFCYGVFYDKGWTLQLINTILSGFQQKAGLFSELLYTKQIALYTATRRISLPFAGNQTVWY